MIVADFSVAAWGTAAGWRFQTIVNDARARSAPGFVKLD
jgi:hypothetical protein